MPDHPYRRWRAAASALLAHLLPSHCALCAMGCDGVVCAPCAAAYARPRARSCLRCANPLFGLALDGPAPTPGLALCGACRDYPPEFDATIAAVDYAAPLDQLVLQLKFASRLALAPWFAQNLVEAVLARRGMPLPDLLCPVPLGPARLVERGFNQALEIARPLSKALGIELCPTLAARTTETQAQSGVAPSERASNIRGAFAVTDPDRVAGRHVGVVDDVMTSGHTLRELAATFKRFGAARVTNLVFARTPPRSTAI
ncbi:ComF family protein [Massilia sp. 9096]|uniref:ComF family protein n=1 Tax=Massilia sp. 9096 TaxID=1500894 RepID=UPI00056BE5AF|nr:ComF family protein [Massilia sp. 9096]